MPSIVPAWACIQYFCRCLGACNACGSSRGCLLGLVAMKSWMKRRIEAIGIDWWFFASLRSRGISSPRSSPWSGTFELPAWLPRRCQQRPHSSSAWSPRTICRPAFGGGPVASPVSSALLGLASLQSFPARIGGVAPSARASFCSDWGAILAYVACLFPRLWICCSDLTGSSRRLFCLVPRFSGDFWGLSFLTEPFKSFDCS